MNTVRHIFLPYCLQRLKDGRYIVLNRKYKPLGISSSAWITYETDPSVQKIKGITAAKARALSHRGDDDIEKIYLYSDGCIPTATAEDMAAYSKRLTLLAKLEISDDK